MKSFHDQVKEAGFSIEDVWHEARATGSDDRQALNSLIAHDKQLEEEDAR